MINLFWRNLITFRYPIIINILLFIYYFSIASLTPYAADDFVYKVNPLEYDISFKVLKDAFNFQIWHYFNWGGRIIVLYFVQLKRTHIQVSGVRLTQQGNHWSGNAAAC